MEAAWPSRCHPAACSPAESRNSSAFSCCDAFASPFPSHDASGGVAAHLMHLATTAQLALVLEFWGDGVRIGECRRQNLQGSRRACHHQCAGQRFGRRGSKRTRWSALEGGGGHDAGVTPSRQRISAPSHCRHGWRCPGGCTTQEGTHVPRTRGA